MKRIDWVIEQYIANWLKGETMDGFVSYGLDSDFIEVVIADNYKAFMSLYCKDWRRKP